MKSVVTAASRRSVFYCCIMAARVQLKHHMEVVCRSIRVCAGPGPEHSLGGIHRGR